MEKARRFKRKSAPKRTYRQEVGVVKVNIKERIEKFGIVLQNIFRDRFQKLH